MSVMVKSSRRQVSYIYLVRYSLCSAPALPEMYRICNMCEVDSRIAALGIPMSLTMTANGSALFIVISCLFLTQIDNTSVEFEVIILVG